MKSDLELLTHLGTALHLRTRLPDHSENSTIEDLLIEGLLNIRSKSKGLVLLKPNRAQVEYSRNCTRRNIVLKARQLGMTTYIAARFFIHAITQLGTTAVQVAHNQESAEEIFKIVHRFWENLPEGMRKGALVTSRSNVRQIVFPRLDSEYRVATAADSNAGRGLTIHNLHCSEVARWPRDGMETLASLRAAVPANGEIVLESTPNGAGGVFYEEWQRANETGYQRHFFPWWYDGDYCVQGGPITRGTFTPEEEQLMDRERLTDAQIAWRRINRAQLRGLAIQEFAEDAVTCFRASGDCVFDLDAIGQALAVCGEPVETRDSGRMVTWLPPQPGRQYILGVDPAGGGSEGDYACVQVIERRTAMQCAELHGHFPPRELAMKTIELGRSYNHGLLVVERNNHGYGVLAHLQAAGSSNVFRDGGQDGWLTSAASRPAMVENLAAVLATEPKLFKSKRLLNECRTFVRFPDGNTGAAGGTHDDCVMAMAVALAARRTVVGELSRGGMLEMASLPVRG